MTARRKKHITTRSVYTFKSEGFAFRPGGDDVVIRQNPDDQANLLIMLMIRAIPEQVISRFCSLTGISMDTMLNIDASLTLTGKQARKNAGEAHGANILQESQVRHIRKMRGIARQIDLAEQYKVSPTTISDIWRGKTWTHLLEEKAEIPEPETPPTIEEQRQLCLL